MKSMLLEQKFILQEHRFILNEAPDTAPAAPPKLIDAIEKVLTACDKAIQQVQQGSGLAKQVSAAYSDFTNTIRRTKTTRIATNDPTALKTSLAKFWGVINPILSPDEINVKGDDIVGILLTKEVKKAQKSAAQIINTTGPLTPTEGGKNVNEKLLLNAAIDTEDAFKNLIFKIETKDTTRAEDTLKVVDLKSIKQSFEIYKNNNEILTTDAEVQQKIINFSNNFDPGSGNLTAYKNEILELNKTIQSKPKLVDDSNKNKFDDTKQSWDVAYKNAADKNAFWDRYYKTVWKENADRVFALGKAFQNSCVNWGFTEKNNPMITFVRKCVLNNNYAINTFYFSGIYAAVLNNVVTKRNFTADVAIFDTNFEQAFFNIMFIPNLYNSSLSERDFTRYLSVYSNFRKSSIIEKRAEYFTNIFIKEGDVADYLNIQLKAIEDVEREADELGILNSISLNTINSDDIAALAQQIATGAIRALQPKVALSTLITIVNPTQIDALTAKIQEVYDLGREAITTGQLINCKKELGKYGVIEANEAAKLIDQIVNIIKADREKKANAVGA